MNSFQIGMNSFQLIFSHSATVNCARQKRQWHCVFALLGYLQPAAKLVTGHWWQGTWGQVALTHADTISTQYLHKFIAKFCRHIYQILSIIYYLHTLCSRGAPGLRQVTWWCVSWLPPTAPHHAPSPVTHVFHKNMKAAISSSGRAREPQKKCHVLLKNRQNWTTHPISNQMCSWLS